MSVVVSDTSPLHYLILPIRVMTETEAKVIAAWKEAAADLGIRFTSPFTATAPDGRRYDSLGLVHHFGRRVGTLISVLDEPTDKFRYPCDDDYFTSALGSGYGRYIRQSFIDTLDHWQFFWSRDRAP